MSDNILNQIIQAKGLSYVSVAKMTGLYPGTVRRHALGIVKPRLEALNIYAKVFKVPLGRLLRWHVNTPEGS